MMTRIVAILCLCLSWESGAIIRNAAGPLGAVYPQSGVQENPAISGSLVTWQTFNQQRGDYDVLVADVNLTGDRLILAIDDVRDQMNPQIWRQRLVWQEYTIRNNSQDWDIFLADMEGTIDGIVPVFNVSGVLFNDEQWPVIHGNVIAWQDGFAGHADIYAADITDINFIWEFPVAAFDGNQVAPAIWRNQILWQDDAYGDWDIFGSDVWLRKRPLEYAVASEPFEQAEVAIANGIAVWQDNRFGDWDIVGLDMSDHDTWIPIDVRSRLADQTHPAIDGNLVVYQDNRNGDWDIYATHLPTGQEIRITQHKSDQINPAISGPWIVYQDNRNGRWQIHTYRLTPTDIPSEQ